MKNKIFFFLFLNMNIAGLVNREIQNKFNPYVPITEDMLSIFYWFKKLYATKFHGNPVSIVPLINSITPKSKEKTKKELIIVFGFKIIKK